MVGLVRRWCLCSLSEGLRIAAAYGRGCDPKSGLWTTLSLWSLVLITGSVKTVALAEAESFWDGQGRVRVTDIKYNNSFNFSI